MWRHAGAAVLLVARCWVTDLELRACVYYIMCNYNIVGIMSSYLDLEFFIMRSCAYKYMLLLIIIIALIIDS